MRPSYHLLSAGIAGYPYYGITGALDSAVCFATAAVMMDIDHVIDYILWNERPLSLRLFFKKGTLLKGSRMVFFLHGYECIALCYLISWWFNSRLFFAVSNGFMMHLVLDEIGNRLPSACVKLNTFFYFFVYRWIKGFRINKISRVRQLKEVM
ncbi:MAG: hypothetical protein ACYC69_04495 [Thermodesulfovibrionales bacterium]